MDQLGQKTRKIFLADRRKGIGGSDAAIIAGLSSRLPLELFYEKREELPEKTIDNPQAEWGIYLESPIASLYRKVTKRRVARSKTVQHLHFAFIRGNIDRFTWDKKKGKGVLEIKTAFWTKKKTWEREGIPENYYVQLQHYLMVTGCQWGSFAILFGGSMFEHFDVPRDQNLIDHLLPMELEFWDRVQTNRPPDPTYDAMGSLFAGRLHPQSTEETLIATDNETMGIAKRYARLSDSIDRTQRELNETEAWLKFKMGDHGILKIPEVAEITWKTSTRHGIDAEALRKKYPKIAKRVLKESISRRFSFKDRSEAEEEKEGQDQAVASGELSRTRRGIALED